MSAICVLSGCASSTLGETELTLVPAAEVDDFNRPFLAPIGPLGDIQHEAIVRLVGAVSCSGTIIGDKLVLTAHHCVSERDARGRVLQRDVEPSSIRVELGGDDLPWGEVGVRAIVSPACGYEQGDGDVAILVLDRELVDMPVLTPRVTSAPLIDEEVTPWGFGRCGQNTGAIRRESREGGRITSLDRGVFRADAAICPGDSGGPVLDSRREVVGVVSAGVMDTDPNTRDVAYFARLDRFQQLFSAAQEVANSPTMSPNELPPYRSCE